MFQHLINLIDSDIAVFSSFPDGEQHFTVDRQAHVLLDFFIHKERKKETGELFLGALCLIAQLGFGIRDFRQALIPLVESLEDEDISRNPKGFS